MTLKPKIFHPEKCLTLAVAGLLIPCWSYSSALASPINRKSQLQVRDTSPAQSTFFSTAAEESYSTYQLRGDGDLWPSCWGADNNVYTASGDGAAFTGSSKRYDMGVSVIRGMPPDLKGKTLATNVGTNYSGPGYNRKPTGMLCIHGDIYLAFQNLNDRTFSDAPAASIAESQDHGLTWMWNKRKPMFGTPGNPSSAKAYKFTTIFFLDFGKNSAHAIDKYVYAYGLDKSWRGRSAMYLARVPNTKIMDRPKWQFFTGLNADGAATWSKNIVKKKPVLVDDRVVVPAAIAKGCPVDQHVIGQGGVVYDAPLKRYIFASWSCSTHEFYEAPHPWGPWRHFLSRGFGLFRLPVNRGQYGTSIPSKFISKNGKTLYVQSNVCCGGDSYTFSLRKLYLQTYHPTTPTNGFSSVNLATMPGTRAISVDTHFGSLCGRNCADKLVSGPADRSEDDYDGVAKMTDWWGYIWPRSYNIDHVVYETGKIYADGGWYKSDLHVQVRRGFKWIDVANVSITPAYPYSSKVHAHTIYTLNFPATCGDGIRIIGTPGGVSHFTSITQLSVYYGGGNRVTVPSTKCHYSPSTRSRKNAPAVSSNDAP